MLKILIFIAVLCAAIFAGPYLADQQGYVHIATDNYVVETSLTTAVIILIAAFLVLYLLIGLLRRLLAVPHGTRLFFSGRSIRRTLHRQRAAALAFEEEDHQRVLTLIRRSGKLSELPVETIFLGAKSAFALKHYELCSTFLDEAKKRGRQARISSSLIRAKLNLQIGNAKAALEILDELKGSYKSKLLTRLTMQCYDMEHDEEKLARLTPTLISQHILSREEAAAQARRNLLQQISRAADSAELASKVKALDKKARQDPALMGPVTEKQVALGDTAAARRCAIGLLKKQLNADLLNSIARWRAPVPEVLSFLLKHQPEADSKTKSAWLKAMGNLELLSGEINAAQEHLEEALKLSPLDSAISLMLARVMSAQRLFDQACEYYQQAVQTAPALPPVKAEKAAG